MAVDPRFNFVVRCPQGQAAELTDAEKRKDFFGTVGANAAALGGIEMLSSVGGGAVGEGLRTLASVSDAIRGGTDSAIITNGVSGDQDGANVVLAEVGINPQSASAAAAFNPRVVNEATAEASSIYERVTSGDFGLSDIPNSFQSLQNLSTLVGGIITDEPDPPRVEKCGATPYAQALIRYAPKFKFMFIMQITLNPEYQSWDDEENGLASQMAFVIKNTGRPNINIEHEEVNMYNFWTRVPKRTVYEPVTMRFYDDTQNKSHLFFNAYLEAISPIARLGGIEKGTSVLNHEMLEDSGLKGSRRDLDSSASLGALEGNNTSIISEIRVFHLFNHGRSMSVYNYKNPKVLAMNLDDLDMADNGGGSEVEFQFAYDALHITPELPVKKFDLLIKGLSGESIGITDLNIRPVYGEDTDADQDTELPKTEEESLLDQAGAYLTSAQETVTGYLDKAGAAAYDFFNDDSAGGGGTV